MRGLFILNVLAAFTLFAQDYDLVSNGGRVMDPETNFDGMRNVGINVGIKDGKIVAITKNAIKSDRTINILKA
jgi:N-acyl-D-aspartate/D-glutamate deacylase